ncbi:hypothetical protein Acr_07g0013400 [Actinidia rufa]|uniref:Uncharacterized protein n=1 Tax=Actinidia rufa TaxID=165716 RepID=A0A7J0EXF3_9ERIC|nr:hypothetical protein Acr_07g0013400 [Actinidia rufa]
MASKIINGGRGSHEARMEYNTRLGRNKLLANSQKGGQRPLRAKARATKTIPTTLRPRAKVTAQLWHREDKGYHRVELLPTWIFAKSLTPNEAREIGICKRSWSLDQQPLQTQSSRRGPKTGPPGPTPRSNSFQGYFRLKLFEKLPSWSIRSFLQLFESFVVFVINMKAPKGVSSLLMLRKGKNKMLYNYIKRYWELYNEIEDYSKELAVFNYKLGLSSGKKLYDDLTLNPPINLQDLMTRVEIYAA